MADVTHIYGNEIVDAAARQDVNQLKEDLDDVETALETKAEVDGYYEDMTVGDAEQLVASQFAEDSVPYNFRTTGGSADVGNREYADAIIGGSLVWNQLFSPTRCQEALPYTHNGITYSLVDGDIVLNGTATANSLCVFYARIISGHKYLRKNLKSDGLNMFGTYPLDDVSVVSASSDNNYISISVPSGTTLNNYIYDGQIFDLTQMFGSTIADYIYSLEQATAGAGVAWFKKLFPKDYYEYNAGELLSVSGLASHDTVGFNQWDEEWEVGDYNINTGEKKNSSENIRSKGYIQVLPGATYYLRTNAPAMSTEILFYDVNKNYLNYGFYASGNTFRVSSKCHYIRFYVSSRYGTTYNHDICINLSWSGWRNGEYEPYQKHSYPLDNGLTLRGIPKLDADNKLYYDGDVYESDGTVTRKYGIVDLGTLTWVLNATNEFAASVVGAKGAAYADVANAVFENYLLDTYNHVHGHSVDKTAAVLTNSYLYVYDTAYTDAAAFKTAMSGVYLVYELAESTTETAEPYQQTQICDDFGTEEFVSTSIVPVGHSTRYPANLRDKLQHLPDLADDDGYYMIGQSNKQMHLERFRIPKAPTADGAYILKATVSGGTPTYTWEAQT